MEIATILTYGVFISKEVEEAFMNINKSDIHLNYHDPSILMVRNTFITNLPFSLFSKYYIENIGTIPRWSKLHKKIKQYHMNAILSN